jgi:hypothetical protein
MTYPLWTNVLCGWRPHAPLGQSCAPLQLLTSLNSLALSCQIILILVSSVLSLSNMAQRLSLYTMHVLGLNMESRLSQDALICYKSKCYFIHL